MTDNARALHRLKLDLAAFADPGSDIDARPLGDRWFEVSWEEDGAQRDATVLLDEADPTSVRLANGNEQDYRTFLAGPEMGNLKSLARNTLQVLKPLQTFVSPRARLEGQTLADSEAVQLLVTAAQPPEDGTAVVFVAADAGVGKTELLKATVRLQAERYLSGEASSLWLYVDAQARRLAALDEALAGDLGKLRARFSFDAASPLVRTGAMTLVVDGFDELIGSVGAYDEAFSSLADFIGGLDGGGAVVAAARSAYYEQEFLARVGRGLGRGERWLLRPVRLREWRPEDREAYVLGEASRLGLAAADAVGVAEQVESALSAGELVGVAGKPFFVARTTELVLEDALPVDPDAGGLLQRLVQAYLEREARKQLDLSRLPLLSVESLRAFFDELAVEMWRQESRELTRSTVRELAALVGELQGLDEDTVREVATRAPYLAMLREGSLPGSVGWEHDVFFAHFLSRPIADVVRGGSAKQLARLLRRGRLPEDGALLAGRLTQDLPGQALLDLMAAASQSEAIETDRVRRNAGLLAAGWLAGQEHEGLVLHDLSIGDISLSAATLRGCALRNIDFAGTDISAVRFEECRNDGGTFLDRVVVDTSRTRLAIANLPQSAFFGLVVRHLENERVVYSPAELREALHTCGLPAAAPVVVTREVDPDLLDLLERLARIYSRTNVVVEGADNDLVPITGNSAWPRLRKALVDSGVVSASLKSSSGHKVFLERTVGAVEIMAGLSPQAIVPEAVTSLWDSLEAEALDLK